MSTATAPIKISAETDELVSHAAHFLGKAKKDIVDAAVREFVENHRDELQNAALGALRALGPGRESRVALLAGVSVDELRELGGVTN